MEGNDAYCVSISDLTGPRRERKSPMADTSDAIPPTPDAAAYSSDDLERPPIPDVDAPFELLARWLKEAREREPNDANAMVLSTVDAEGMPDSRVVLLKDVSEAGFTFYTNMRSTKARELEANPRAALNFHWKSLRRQVRIRGSVTRVSPQEADAYFASRTRESQIGAWASDQSQPLPNRETLETKVELFRNLHMDDKVTRPPHWSGFRLVPSEVEFWQDRPYRLHDRLKLILNEDGGWDRTRLYP